MSTVTPSYITQAAARLRVAASSGVPCPPVRDLIGPTDVVAAYAVQNQLTHQRHIDGSQTTGWKIGLTSQAVQQQLRVDQPDFGVLFDDMGFSNNDVLPMSRMLQPKVEAEVAFVLRTDLTENSFDCAQIYEAIDYAVPALEIVDSRIIDWDITFADTVADNASSGLYVLGQEPVPLDVFNPVDAQMEMLVDDKLVSSGDGSACLGDPIAAVAWLARTVREFGESLSAGHVILSGALGPMYPVHAGAHVTAQISGLGTVAATFSDRE